jgi:hypothetical protein
VSSESHPITFDLTREDAAALLDFVALAVEEQTFADDLTPERVRVRRALLLLEDALFRHLELQEHVRNEAESA